MKTVNHTLVIIFLAMMLLSATMSGSAEVAVAEAFDQTYAVYDGMLKTFVSDDRVDYPALKADPDALERYLDSAAGVPEAQFNSWSEPQRLAFLINLYNAATLRLILDHYPVKSIKDIGSFFKGPWDQPVVRLFGKIITLNKLEHGILRKQYNEPRIHMALVCAAKGCPPLLSDAYTAKRLNEQLEAQSRRFLISPAGLRIDPDRNILYVSSIFKWYGDDFRDRYSPADGFIGLNETERSVANFCRGYLSASDGDYLAKGAYSIKYLDYDWSLNERQGKP